MTKNSKVAANKPSKIPKTPKKCPDNKVLNPKTGRCILIRKKYNIQ
jgi:hypothetical protein